MLGIGATWTACSSEPVLSASSTAARAARIASGEPSVARRIFVGNISRFLLD
jgi:hypothetical protein